MKFEFIDKVLAKNSWLAVKEAYYKDKDVFAAEDVDTYSELWAKLYNLQAYLALMEGG